MAERILLRSLLYFVFGWCLLAQLSPHNSDDVKSTIAFAAVLALGFLAVSAYEPRYDPRYKPPPKRPRED